MTSDTSVELRRILMKLERPTRSGDDVVTAYRDGVVTLRSARRVDGYTMSDKEQGYQGVDPGDFVFHALDGFAGAVGISDARGKCSPVYHVCAAPLGDDLRYIRWALRSAAATGYLESMAPSTRQRSVDFRNWESFGALRVPRPAPEEQIRIADFLDEQVGLLAEALDELTELEAGLAGRALQARRRLLIGDEDFPPATAATDARIIPARYLCRVSTGSGDTQDAAVSGDYPFFVRSDIPLVSRTFTFDTEAVMTSGDGAGVGKIFHHFKGRFHAHQRVYVLHQFKQVLPRYFFHYFAAFFGDMALDGSAKSTVDSVRRDMITSMPFLVPNIDTQQSICARLDGQEELLSEARSALQAQRRLLAERRDAVITACVTGKFDVTTASSRAADAALQGVRR
jgi:type I restriction enzyme S subunit